MKPKPKSFLEVFILIVDLLNCTVMKLYLFLSKLLIKSSINQSISHVVVMVKVHVRVLVSVCVHGGILFI